MILPRFYEHHCPTKILAGQMALSNLTFEMQRLGGSRALVIADQSLARGLALARLRQAYRDAGASLIEFIWNGDRPTANQARAAADQFRQAGCDCLVALGSPATMNLTKAAAILSQGLDLQTADIDTRLPLMIAVPTTYCAGQAVSNWYEISAETGGARSFLKNDQLYPQLAVIDPINSLKASDQQAFFYGLDALSLATQAFIGTTNPVVEIYASAAIELARRYLARAAVVPADREASQALASASLYAGIAFSAEATGPLAALADARQDRRLNGALLPLLLAFEAGRNPERVLALNETLGGGQLSDESQVLKPVELMQRICWEAAAMAKARLDLESLDLAQSELETLAEKASQSPFAGETSTDDLLAILRQA
ncbi:MAG: Alcohol dehydrogenase [Deltaproteobacteria bacterium ADurb.Bin510]|nr:MAG: Alcohol dehydrogenase [Deltaproteobacteria bacterium ADurb.Bin510]